MCIMKMKTPIFTEVIGPIKKTRAVAPKGDARVNRLTQALKRRTEESSLSRRHLAQGVARREAAEAALKKSGDRGARLLREATCLQNSLRADMRTVLSALEKQRHKTSLHLQDEIAQTLLAINIRLLSMKTSAKTNTVKLESEIANTQRLVRSSLKRLNRYSHECNIQQ